MNCGSGHWETPRDPERTFASGSYWESNFQLFDEGFAPYVAWE
jgi:hypothetical protein